MIATASADFPLEAALPSVEQVALNLRNSGRSTPTGLVHVRLRRVEAIGPGLNAPVVLAEATRNLNTGTVEIDPG